MSANDPNLSAYLSKGLRAYERGEYDQAERDVKENLVAVENLLHAQEVIKADLFHVLANVYRERDQFDEAEPLYSKAIAIKEAEEDSSSKGLLRLFRDRALCSMFQGRFSEAFVHERAALSSAQANASKHKFEVLTSLSRLAAIAYTGADYEQSKRYYVRILEEREKQTDRKEPRLRPLFADLGMICYHLGQYAEAEEHFRRALSLAPEDEECGSLRNNLGLALCAERKHSEAQPVCQHSAEARARNIEDTTSELLNNIADEYCTKGRFVDSQPLCESAAALREEAGEDGKPDLARKLQMYCRLLRRVNCCEKTDGIERRIQRLKNQ